MLKILIRLVFCFSSSCMKQLRETLFCHSAQWLTVNRPCCGHCLRVSVEGVTIDGELKRRKRRRVNYERERLRLENLYRNTHALRKRRILERRVFNSYGFLIASFFFLSIDSPSWTLNLHASIRFLVGLILIKCLLIFESLFYITRLITQFVFVILIFLIFIY